MLKRKIFLMMVLVLCITISGCGIVMRQISESDESEEEENLFITQEAKTLDESHVTYYYYDRLHGTDKELYCLLYNGIVQMDENIPIPEYIDYDIVNRIFRYMMYDHPEIFWISGYQMVEIKNQMILYPEFSISPQNIDYYNEKCKKFVSGAEQAVGKEQDAYKIALLLYEFMIKNIHYVHSADDQNMISAVLTRRAVCTGFVKTYQYLLNQYGIESVAVTGFTREGIAHMWNLVKIDGRYYYTDVTYGQVNSTDTETNYDLFNVTTEEIEKIYEFEAGQILEPCISEEANFFVKNGSVYEKMDKGKLKSQFAKGLPVTIKCSSEELYQEMIRYLIKEKHIYDYLPEQQDINYRTNDELKKIYFF